MEQTKILTFGNATIIVHRPELTETERAKQENRIITALQQFGRETEERKV